MSFRNLNVDFLSGEQQQLIAQMQELSHTDLQVNPNDLYSSRATQVRALISKGNAAEALATALADPIYGLSDTSLQDKIALLVVDVLSAARTQDAAQILAAIPEDSLVVLLKYIYYGLARPAIFNCAVLLPWHEKVVESTGVGGIARVMSDRRTL